MFHIAILIVLTAVVCVFGWVALGLLLWIVRGIILLPWRVASIIWEIIALGARIGDLLLRRRVRLRRQAADIRETWPRVPEAVCFVLKHGHMKLPADWQPKG